MKRYLYVAVMLTAGCASVPSMPEQQPFTVEVTGDSLQVAGALVSRSKDLDLQAQALAQVFSAVNDARYRCDFANAQLSLDEIANAQYQVSYDCPASEEIVGQAQVNELPESCPALPVDKPSMTEWQGRKLPFSSYQGAFTITSQPAMPALLAQNWAEQTLLANAVAGGYECRDIVIDSVSPECAHYGFVLRCENL